MESFGRPQLCRHENLCLNNIARNGGEALCARYLPALCSAVRSAPSP